jgi:Uma2 family endonuclease
LPKKGESRMATVEAGRVHPMSFGDRLTKEEFLRIWEGHPEIKRAELIGGVVYMPSPLSFDHGAMEVDVVTWIGNYRAWTPGTSAASNTTSFILDDTLQPDANLHILPEFGRGCWIEDDYIAGIPELLAEVCRSSRAYDLHQKLDIYQAAGIPEYLTVLLYEQEVRWHILTNGEYQLMPPDADGIWRSRVFPGLWLDGKALLAGDSKRVLAKLDEGLKSPEHQAFVEKLARYKESHSNSNP